MPHRPIMIRKKIAKIRKRVEYSYLIVMGEIDTDFIVKTIRNTTPLLVCQLIELFCKGIKVNI